MPLNLVRLFDEDEVASIIATSSPSLPAAATIEDLDTYGEQLNDLHKPARLHLKPRDYWAAVKDEFWLLTCTNNRKYASLRKTLRAGAKKSQGPAISMISVALGATLGIVSGLLTPFIAMLIKFCLKIGLEAFCKAVKAEKQQS